MHARYQLIRFKHRNIEIDSETYIDSHKYLALLAWLDQLGLSRFISESDDESSLTALIIVLLYKIESLNKFI